MPICFPSIPARLRRAYYVADIPRVFVLAALGVASAGCQSTGVIGLDRTAYDPPIYDARGVLFETDRRYVVMQFTQSPMDGVVDSDSYLAYVSLPIREGRRIDFSDTGFAVGWSNVVAVFSDLFEEKAVDPYDKLPYDWIDVPELNVDPNLLLPPPAPVLPNKIDTGRQLEIVDYAALMRSSLFKVEFGAPDPEDRPTD